MSARRVAPVAATLRPGRYRIRSMACASLRAAISSRGMTLTLDPCWLSGTSIVEPATVTESFCGAMASVMIAACAKRNSLGLEARRGHQQIRAGSIRHRNLKGAGRIADGLRNDSHPVYSRNARARRWPRRTDRQPYLEWFLRAPRALRTTGEPNGI